MVWEGQAGAGPPALIGDVFVMVLGSKYANLKDERPERLFRDSVYIVND